jgi:hypothetical protein
MSRLRSSRRKPARIRASIAFSARARSWKMLVTKTDLMELLVDESTGGEVGGR